MARVEKYSKAAIGNLFAHFERRQKLNKETGEMEYVKFGNRDIDTRYTPLNYRVWPPLDFETTTERGIFVSQATQDIWDALEQDPEEPALTRFRRIFRSTPHSNRKDLKCLCDWCISLPDGIPADRMDELWDICIRYCIRHYGAENIVGAWVHVDEAHRPHLDVAFVPVVGEGENRRICARDLIKRKHLSDWHGGLTAMVQEKMGIENPGILNGKTKAQGGNRTVKQMKASDKQYEKTKGYEVKQWRKAQLKLIEKADRAGKTNKLDNLLTDIKTRQKQPLKEPKKGLGDIIKNIR